MGKPKGSDGSRAAVDPKTKAKNNAYLKSLEGSKKNGPLGDMSRAAKKGLEKQMDRERRN